MFLRHLRLPLCLAAIVALGATTLVVPARGAENLLVNPSFEDALPGHPWMPAGWDTSATGLPTSFFGRDTFLVHGGHFAVSAASASDLVPMAHNWTQTVLVDSTWWGKDLVLTMWTRTVGLEGRGYVLLQAYRDTASVMAVTWGVPRDEALERLGIHKVDDPLICLGWKRTTFNEPETQWVKREARVYLAPTTNVVFVRAGLYGVGQIFLDDASLTLEPALPPEVPTPGENLLVDGDLEGDLLAWEFSTPAYPGFEIGPVTDMATSGLHSVRFTGGEGLVQGKTGMCQGFSNRALAGKRLRLTGDIKPDSLKSLAGMKIYCHTLHGVVQATSSLRPSGTKPWMKTTVELDVPDDTYLVWAWFAYSGPAPGVVHFDNASLVVVESADAESAATKP